MAVVVLQTTLTSSAIHPRRNSHRHRGILSPLCFLNVKIRTNACGTHLELKHDTPVVVAPATLRRQTDRNLELDDRHVVLSYT